MAEFAIVTFEEPESLQLIKLFPTEIGNLERSDDFIKIIKSVGNNKYRVSVKCMNRPNPQQYLNNKCKLVKQWLDGIKEKALKVDNEEEKVIVEQELEKKKACFTFTEDKKLFHIYTRKEEELEQIVRDIETFKDLLSHNESTKQPAAEGNQGKVSNKSIKQPAAKASQKQVSSKSTKPPAAEANQGQVSSKSTKPPASEASQEQVSKKSTKPPASEASQEQVSKKSTKPPASEASQEQVSKKSTKPPASEANQEQVSKKSTKPPASEASQEQVSKKSTKPPASEASQEQVSKKSTKPPASEASQEQVSKKSTKPPASEANQEQVSKKSTKPPASEASQEQVSKKSTKPPASEASQEQVSKESTKPPASEASQEQVSKKSTKQPAAEANQGQALNSSKVTETNKQTAAIAKSSMITSKTDSNNSKDLSNKGDAKGTAIPPRGSEEGIQPTRGSKEGNQKAMKSHINAAESCTLQIHIPEGNSESSTEAKTDLPAPKVNEDLKLYATLKAGLIVRIYKADITTIDLDAIVNPANEKLHNTGGAADVISKAAGGEFDRDCEKKMKEKKHIKTTENVVTTAGKLPCKYVINAVGPQWVDYKDKMDCLADLEKTIIKILETAEKQEIVSVAIPPISSGIFGVPGELCAPIYITSIMEFGSKQRSYPREVHLVDIADDILDSSCFFYKEWNKKKILDIKQLLQNFARRNPQAMSRTAVPQTTDRDPTPPGVNPSPNPCKFVGNPKGKHIFEIGGKLQVFIYRDDLVRVEGIDVLISPENSVFSGSGALAQSIFKAAGWQYQQELQNLQEKIYRSGKALKHGETRIISAGKLKYKNVVHVVVNRLSKNRPPMETELQEFKNMLKNMLRYLDALAQCNMNKSHGNFRLNSIAMPLLGAGGITNPVYLESICSTVYDALEEYTETTRRSALKEIHLVSYFEEVNAAFTNVFLAISKQGFIHSRQKPPTQRPKSASPMYEEGQIVSVWKLEKKKNLPNFQQFVDEIKKPPPDNCVICMDTFTKPVKLRKCNHIFCKECIMDFFSMKSACPVCNCVYGTIYGDQPKSGTAKIYLEKTSLPGHKGGTYVIVYDFPNGTQEECHPAPGFFYKGTRRQAYLPATKDGSSVLHMLERAFKQGLIFTVGSSRTTGYNNVVTWNDIHHKTRTTGGPERFGYPDPDYLLRVREELEAKGITDMDQQ